MVFSRFNAIYLGVTTFQLSSGEELPPAEIKGYKFYVDGKHFPIKGIDYYPRPNDGELDENGQDLFTEEYKDLWTRDIPQLKALGVNVVRLYSVDPSKNHDNFMATLAANGMYAMVGLAATCKDCAVTKMEAPACYTGGLKERGQFIINTFSRYTNTLAFSAGNEVNHVVKEGSPQINGPCQKKFLRDMRVYVNQCSGLRKIPIGVIVADTDREENALYYGCRSDASDEFENAEFYGLNVYLHCDGNAVDTANLAGFDALKTQLTSYNYPVPLLLTEYGCLDESFKTIDGKEAQRNFLQTTRIYEKDFLDILAGGFVFEYSTELANSKKDSDYPFTGYGAQNYGVGWFSPENCDDQDIPCKFNRFPNFDALATSYGGVDTSAEVSQADFTPDSNRIDPTTCPDLFPALSTFTWESDEMKDLTCEETIATSGTGKGKAVDLPSMDSGDGSGAGSDVSMLTYSITMTFLTLVLSTILF